jgi:hypothetical protein
MPTVQEYRTNVVNQINSMTAPGAASPVPGGAPLSDGAKAILNEYKNYAAGLTGNQPMQEFGAWMLANKDRLTASVPGGRDAVNQVRSIYNGYVGDTPPSPPPMTALRQEGQRTFGNNRSLPLDSPGYVPPAVTTPDIPGGGQPEGGGIGGFLKKNMGGLIGLAAGIILPMIFGGGGGGGIMDIIMKLLPFVAPILGSLLVDKGDGLIGGLLGMEKSGPSRSQAVSQGVGAPAQAVSTSVAPAAPSIDQTVSITPNSQVQVKNGTQVINGMNGNTVAFAPASGTPPRGQEVTIAERGAGNAVGFQYTGRVEGDNFVITSVAAPVAGSNPVQMAAPVRPDTPISLPIGADGKVNFQQPDGSALATTRTRATEKAANFNRSKDLTITEVATPPGQAQKVSTQLDPVTRDGVTYNVTLQGTRDASGMITFNTASMTQTTGTPPTTTPVNNPNTGAPTFEVRNMPPVRQSAGTPPKITVTEGLASTMSEDLVNFTRRGQRQAEAAQAQARGQRQTALLGAINSAPNAEQAINNLESTLSTQLTQSGMNPLDANLAANTVSNFYTQQSNRGATFNADTLKDQLKNTMRPAIPGNPPQRALTDRQVDAIVAEVSSQNTAVSAAINAKPMVTVPAGSVTPAPTASSNITRVARPMTAPTVGTPVAPLAIPGLNPGTTAGVGGP